MDMLEVSQTHASDFDTLIFRILETRQSSRLGTHYLKQKYRGFRHDHVTGLPRISRADFILDFHYYNTHRCVRHSEHRQFCVKWTSGS